MAVIMLATVQIARIWLSDSFMVYRFSAMTVTINSIDTMAIQEATINALSACFSVLTNWFCLCIFMVCLWFVLLIKDVKTYLASLFKRACPVWTAVVRVIVIRAARVIRSGSVYNRQSLVKTWMPLCFG